jgi:hypothetical protein
MSSKYKKFIACADVHGDKQDPRAVKAFLEFNSIWKADIRLMLGDLWDFMAIRRGASQEEKEESMQYDFIAGMQFFHDYKPTHFLRGNHDQRLWDLAQFGRGLLGDYAQHGVKEIEDAVRKAKCHMLPYDKKRGVLKLGHMKCVHGYYAGLYASKKHAETYGSVLIGHNHTIDEYASPGLDRRVGRCIGWLGNDSVMDYTRAKPGVLRWAHGWAYGIINKKTGLYNVWQAEKIGGVFSCPSDVIHVGRK